MAPLKATRRPQALTARATTSGPRPLPTSSVNVTSEKTVPRVAAVFTFISRPFRLGFVTAAAPPKKARLMAQGLGQVPGKRLGLLFKPLLTSLKIVIKNDDFHGFSWIFDPDRAGS